MTAGYLYAVELSSGVIKVGRAQDAAKRIAQHAQRFAAAGITIVAQHQAAATDTTVGEQELLSRCGAHAATKRGREWFTGLLFAEVTRWLDQCCAVDRPAKPPLQPFVIRPARLPATCVGYYICRACCRPHDQAVAVTAFLCSQCLAEGYTYGPDGLRLGRDSVQQFHAAIGTEDGCAYRGVTCEELRPDIPWLRVFDDAWVIGRPLIDYSAPGMSRHRGRPCIDVAAPPEPEPRKPAAAVR